MTESALLRCVILLLPICLGACTKDEDTDYCKNHYRFHDQHLDSVATLNLELSRSGVLNSDLRLPAGVVADPGGTVQLLEQPANVYTLQTTAPCEVADAKAKEADGTILARYQSDCGDNNRLEQVDVMLFGSLPDLDEVVVNVTTPATAKLFAISRQCERAIFRLDPKPHN